MGLGTMAVDRGASFAALLRQQRRRVGLGQQELAGRAGLSVATVRDLEQGRSRRPEPASVRALVTALGLGEDEAAALRDTAIAEDVGSARVAAAQEQGVVRLDVLGPLVLRRGSVQVGLGRGGRRVVLARLALSADTPVSVDELVDLLWGERPPANPHPLLQSYVSRLRSALDAAGPVRPADSVVSFGPGGYRLVLDGQQLDVVEFRGLVRAAQRADANDAVGLLDTALRLWRDGPLADVPELRNHPLVVTLVQEYLTVALRHADLAAQAGQSRAGVAPAAGAGRRVPVARAGACPAGHRPGRCRTAGRRVGRVRQHPPAAGRRARYRSWPGTDRGPPAGATPRGHRGRR